MAERSRYQERIIRNYYENRDAIALQRLQELITELYLAEGKARAKHWKNIASSLETLKIPADRIQHLVQQDNPALVAKLVEEMLGKSH
jgi:heme oxygenase